MNHSRYDQQQAIRDARLAQEAVKRAIRAAQAGDLDRFASIGKDIATLFTLIEERMNLDPESN